ncbi:hypothetical protein [Cribrihabitans neustonicus]|uniref:hypothetical protein n=1 Tax=Cribrihabitans neustonicus TaxID=1429085 RepID=UPI003B5AF3C5
MRTTPKTRNLLKALWQRANAGRGAGTAKVTRPSDRNEAECLILRDRATRSLRPSPSAVRA